MKLPRRRFLQLSGMLAADPLISRVAAQTYPTRPVRLIVGFPAGGSSDIVARIMGGWLSGRLGYPVIIENRPGTDLAFEGVAHSPADGYTLLFFSTSTAINVTYYQKIPSNFLQDITPVAAVVRSPLVLLTNPSLPVKTVAEFVVYAKANPGKINIASFGVGTISHLAIELFKAQTGTDMVHVPYRGGAPMLTDLLGGQMQAAFDALPSSLPHVQGGALRALAVTTATRSDMLSEVPTVDETVPGYEASTSGGIGVPAGTPIEMIETLNRGINAGLANPAIKARLAELGTTPMIFTPAEFSAYMAAEIDKWGKVIRYAGIKSQ
jgi:tripartite-type tricarboxylate transporter receptor subunit TctC